MFAIGEVKRNSGIYLITNTINGKIYVGSSSVLRKRMSKHASELNAQKHNNRYLQHSWNKYGGDNFSFTVLELVPDKNKLIECEQNWLDKLNACDKNIGYNILRKAGSPLGVKHSEEECRKRMYRCSNNRYVLQFDKNGNFIKEWFSVMEVSRELSIKKHIVRYGLDNKKEFNNSYFIYKDEFNEDLLKLVLLGKKERKRKDVRKGNTQRRPKKVNQYDKNGTLIQTWDSIKLACESLKLHSSAIVNCCKGKLKTTGGFIWSYTN